MSRVDLHTHSHCSDGLLSPGALVALAAQRGVELLALTDHDTVAGCELARTACAAHAIRFVSGVELSCEWREREIHVGGLGIDLHDASGISSLTLSYLGGGTVAIGGEASSSTIHQLNVEEDLNWRRMKLSFIDQFAFLPEASFGYAGLGGGVALPGGGSIGLQPGLTPGDSILTTRGNRATNSFLTQADIYLSQRASITVAGGYSLLHYFDNDLVDFGDSIFQAGYNYQLNRKDTVAVFYRFSGYRYSGFNQSINDNSFQASYGRRVTGRFSFQIQGGPDITFVNSPLTAATSTAPASGGQTRELYWSFSTSATYQLQRVSLNASYAHGVSGGSGVLLGSISDTVNGTAGRPLARRHAGSVRPVGQ